MGEREVWGCGEQKMHVEAASPPFHVGFQALKGYRLGLLA